MDYVELLRQSHLESASIRQQIWQQNFMTSRWWAILVLIAVSYAVWWMLVDKRRLPELLLYGSFIAVARNIFGSWGTLTGRWTYVVDLIPLPEVAFINDLTIVALAYMLVYQYSKSWVSFLGLSVITGGVFSYIFFPILVRTGLLVIHNWTYTGTFLFLVITAAVMRGIIHIVLEITHNRQEAGERKERAFRPAFARNTVGDRNKTKV
ncbi:MAG: CBO0543 family protein [bacterium]|jgi:hypothetical protein